MPVLFWLDTGALLFSLVAALALVLTVSGMRPWTMLTYSFTLFSVLVAVWALFSLLLRFSLWLRPGAADMLSELTALCLALFGPALLFMTVRYSERPALGADIAVACGVLIAAGVTVPLFGHRIVVSTSLSANGSTVSLLGPLGYALAPLPAVYLAWAVIVFWRAPTRARDPYLTASAVMLLVGYVTDGVLQIPFPLLSLATAGALAVLGYGLVSSQLFNPLRERAVRLELIARVGQQTTAILDPDELLHRAVQLVRDTFSYYNVNILVVEGGELVLQATSLPAAQGMEGRLRLRIGGEGITGWVAGTGRPVIAADVRRDSRYRQVLGRERTRSELAVPIRLQDRVVGVLDVQSQELAAFGTGDLSTLQTIADQLAVAIENARLYRETRRRAERLAVVNRISSAIGSTLNLDDLLESVYREVAPVFQADAFFVALYDEAAGELDFRLQVDRGVREPPSRDPLGSGLTSVVVRERRPLLISDIQKERSRLPEPEPWGSMKLPPSWLGVPMVSRDRLVGVINVQAYRPGAYGEEEQALLVTIADQVAVALENARLYEAVQQQLQERERTARELAESEEKFRNLADQSPNMIFINAGGRVVYANRKCEELMGYRREEFYAPEFDFMSLVALECRERVGLALRAHLQGREVAPYEYTLVGRAGKRLEAIITTKLIAYGGRTAILGIITEIAARKRTERFLQTLNAAALEMEQELEPERVFRLLGERLESLGFSCAILLVEGSPTRLRLCYRSGAPAPAEGAEGALEIGKRAPDAQERGPATLELQPGDPIGEVVNSHKAVHVAAAHPQRAAEEDGSPLAPILPGILPPGPAVAAPLIVEEECVGVLAVQSAEIAPEDPQLITAAAHQLAAAWHKARLMQHLSRSVEELRSAQEQLLQSQKMEAIGRLAGGVAHDFNNVLTAISGYADVLLSRLAADSSLREDLEEIKHVVRRAATLIRQLLAFSRRQVLRVEELDINLVVARMEQMLSRLLGERIRLVTSLQPGLGMVRADPGQLEQVIMNLVVNARDAMPEGGTLTVATSDLTVAPVDLQSELQPGRYAALRVSDTGVGMEAEIMEHLFEPFFTTKEKSHGTGLGLATVHGIVKQSGGHVTVYSTPGKGTSFVIYIPLAE